MQLVRSAHPLHALVTALVLGGAALATGRPVREAGLVVATVLVGQAVVGWHNDLVDRERDAAHDRPGKPLASGALDPGSVWFALACGVLLLVPLALGNGVTAGCAYLLSVAVALAWATSSCAGRRSRGCRGRRRSACCRRSCRTAGGAARPRASRRRVLVTAIAALLGIAVHFLLALPDLVDDNADGLRHLPLRVALRTGAPRLLWITVAVTVFLAASLVVALATVGLRQ